MEKLEKLDKYVITPNVKFYGGYNHIKNHDILLCDDIEEDEEYEVKIHIVDKIINNKLIKNISKTYKMKNGCKVKQEENQEIELEDKQLLVYVEGAGFVISEFKMVTIDKAIEIYKLLKSPKEE